MRLKALLFSIDIADKLNKLGVVQVLGTIKDCTDIDRSPPILMLTLTVANSAREKVFSFISPPEKLHVDGSYLLKHTFFPLVFSLSVRGRIRCETCSSIHRSSSDCPGTKFSAICHVHALL